LFAAIILSCSLSDQRQSERGEGELGCALGGRALPAGEELGLASELSERGAGVECARLRAAATAGKVRGALEEADAAEAGLLEEELHLPGISEQMWLGTASGERCLEVAGLASVVRLRNARDRPGAEEA